MTDLRSSLRRVRERIAEACDRVGRSPESVGLVAVSKRFSAGRVRDLLACGHDLFGENRVQEALGKIPEVGGGARWHLVGHLQRNKARHVVGVFDLIHSVDSPELAAELDRRVGRAGRVQPVLLQVNVGEEETKHGIGEDRLEPLAEAVLGLEHLDLRGLMTIQPPAVEAEDSRRWFVRLRELRDRLSDRLGRELPELSMGMTDDYWVAIEEGATLIRVGRALFGERPPLA
jgi:pyridoxal phosphate enzyme (YggS family)